MIAVAVLGVLALGGLAGGLAFVTDPTGGRLGMTVEELPTWPLLGSFLLPGIALIVLFGLLPAAAAWLHVRRSPHAWAATTAVGLLLVVWMIGQIVVIGFSFAAMQAAFLIVGIVLTGIGLDGGAWVGSDESRHAERSYAHADDER